MRILAAGTALILAVAGLMTYEVVLLVGVVIAIVLGLVNFVQLGKQAQQLQILQDNQGQRIDKLPPPPGR